ncbi:uncharacterized protein LOC125615313 [Marmota marmota marmota]|uniref:uncharacterized protein LOC125615313 n=1 Tax=Marmota marmota marmota TaxID=9994 RepID=UPI0020934CD0|nr:uncharacterized protein LOC125615313 [Marmota marmota marmota]
MPRTTTHICNSKVPEACKVVFSTSGDKQPIRFQGQLSWVWPPSYSRGWTGAGQSAPDRRTDTPNAVGRPASPTRDRACASFEDPRCGSQVRLGAAGHLWQQPGSEASAPQAQIPSVRSGGDALGLQVLASATRRERRPSEGRWWEAWALGPRDCVGPWDPGRAVLRTLSPWPDPALRAPRWREPEVGSPRPTFSDTASARS